MGKEVDTPPGADHTIFRLVAPAPLPLFVKLTGKVTLPAVPYIAAPDCAPMVIEDITVCALREPNVTKPAKMAEKNIATIFPGRKVVFFIIVYCLFTTNLVLIKGLTG
jgi:hypothetical protein